MDDGRRGEEAPQVSSTPPTESHGAPPTHILSKSETPARSPGFYAREERRREMWKVSASWTERLEKRLQGLGDEQRSVERMLEAWRKANLAVCVADSSEYEEIAIADVATEEAALAVRRAEIVTEQEMGRKVGEA